MSDDGYRLHARCPACGWTQYWVVDHWGWTECRNPYCNDRDRHHYYLLTPDGEQEINPEDCLASGCPYCIKMANLINWESDEDGDTPPTER